jgi:hypothetical protein
VPEAEEEPEVEQGQPLEAVRIGIDVVLTLLCIYVMWGYVKDRPEVESARVKAAAWWTKVTTEGKRMRKAENETVFEAIQVVTTDGGVGDAGN